MLSIREVVALTGVAEGTLRMWEHRHGFPHPRRLPSGHRRYGEEDVELIRRVLAEREAGTALAVAIERARGDLAVEPGSIYATLRRRRPDLEPRRLSKPVMVALSHAIEDESLSRAERPLLFASFQRERFYRQEEPRWREFTRGAEVTAVFADFSRLRKPRDGPIEVPVERSHPLLREWAIVCEALGHAVCLAAWEPPQPRARTADGDRLFEAIWSVEPDVVRDAARICAGVASAAAPELAEAARARLSAEPARPTREQLRLATAISNRTLSYLSGAG